MAFCQCALFSFARASGADERFLDMFVPLPAPVGSTVSVRFGLKGVSTVMSSQMPIAIADTAGNEWRLLADDLRYEADDYRPVRRLTWRADIENEMTPLDSIAIALSEGPLGHEISAADCWLWQFSRHHEDRDESIDRVIARSLWDVEPVRVNMLGPLLEGREIRIIVPAEEAAPAEAIAASPDAAPISIDAITPAIHSSVARTRIARPEVPAAVGFDDRRNDPQIAAAAACLILDTLQRPVRRRANPLTPHRRKQHAHCI